jgi:ADP-ribose pyrophosphatase
MTTNVEIIRSEPLSDGFLRLNRYRLGLAVPGSGVRVVVDRECIDGLRAAVVLPFDPVSGQVVLVEQFRVGTRHSTTGGLTWEPPGGVIAAGDGAAETARREASEETGCRLGAMIRIAVCHTSPGFSDECVDIYCGELLDTDLPATAGHPHEGEYTRVVLRDLDRVIHDLGHGRLTAATLIIAIQWLALNRHRIRELWAADQSGPAAEDLAQ